jgi:hypothetical protein
MKRSQLIAAMGALLLPLMLHAAAGHTSYSSYLQKIPAPPQTAPEAYARHSATAHAALMDALNQEAALTISQSPSAMPGMPAAGDQAGAERLAAQMQNMTQAQQVAMAMQMANAMTSGAQGGGQEWSQAEQEVARLLSEHQGREVELQRNSMDLNAQASTLIQSWGPAHSALYAQEEAELQRPQHDFCAETRATKMKFAAEHEKLAAGELPLLGALIAKHRVLVTEQVGFADHLATKAKVITNPANRAAYGQTQNLAVSLMASQETLTEQAFEYGADWHQRLLDSQKPAAADCGGLG